jgi:hypothetical protein
MAIEGLRKRITNAHEGFSGDVFFPFPLLGLVRLIPSRSALVWIVV